MFKLSRKNITHLIIAASVLFLFLLISPFLRKTTQSSIKPSLSLAGLIKREFLGMVFYHRNMVELSRMHAESEGLRLMLADSREAERENERLRDLLRFKQKSPLRLIPARVIAHSPDNWSSSIVLDKGANSGIRNGMVVINGQGLVGRVVESTGNSSKVLLINDPSQGVPSLVQRTRQQGLVNGSLGSNLIMRYLPDDAQIAPGDTIVTSELSRVYPKGLTVGTVISVGKEFSGLSLYAIVRPAAELSKVEEVLVIIP